MLQGIIIIIIIASWYCPSLKNLLLQYQKFISVFRIVAMFVIVVLWRLINYKLIYSFTVLLHMKEYIPSSSVHCFYQTKSKI
jgi:hypothetical protein